jgi:hypothetical protein
VSLPWEGGRRRRSKENESLKKMQKLMEGDPHHKKGLQQQAGVLVLANVRRGSVVWCLAPRRTHHDSNQDLQIYLHMAVSLHLLVFCATIKCTPILEN